MTTGGVGFLVAAGAVTERFLPAWKWNFLFALAVFILLLVSLGFHVARKSGTWDKEDRSWLDYGNLIIVSFGLAVGLIGFLVILLVVDLFDDKSKALGFLVALFGVITGLVGTYFGVKQSADAREGAEKGREEAQKVALAGGRGNTAPIITIEPPTDTKPVGESHTVTTTVTSVDRSPAANVAVTFTVTEGPDRNTAGEEKTGEFGRAIWSFTNNGTAGTDTIEAKALEATRTATVEFTGPGQGSARAGIREPERGNAGREAEEDRQQGGTTGEQTAQAKQEGKAKHYSEVLAAEAGALAAAAGALVAMWLLVLKPKKQGRRSRKPKRRD